MDFIAKKNWIELFVPCFPSAWNRGDGISMDRCTEHLRMNFPYLIGKEHGTKTWKKAWKNHGFPVRIFPSSHGIPIALLRQKHSIFDEETCCTVDVQEPLAIALLEAMNACIWPHAVFREVV